MPINLFIDTNIWLSFYNPNSEIQILEKLLDKIKSNEINLLIPSHQIDEILRNKEEVIFKQIKKTMKFVGNLNSIKEFPELLKEDFSSFIEKAEEKTQNYKDLAYKEELETDKLLNEIISESKILDDDSNIINLANERTLIRGNPPRKDSSFRSCADAIIWETILHHSKNKEDIIVISNDRDYNSMVDDAKVKLFIKKEWEKLKESNIKLYKSIGSFFHEELGDVRVKPEEIKSEEKSSKAIYSDGFIAPLIDALGSGIQTISMIGASGAKFFPLSGVDASPSISKLNELHEIRCPSCKIVFYYKPERFSFVLYPPGFNIKCDHCGFEYVGL